MEKIIWSLRDQEIVRDNVIYNNTDFQDNKTLSFSNFYLRLFQFSIKMRSGGSVRRYTRLDGGMNGISYGSRKEGEIAMLWKNSDGVYNFIIIGSIASTCLSSIALSCLSRNGDFISAICTHLWVPSLLEPPRKPCVSRTPTTCKSTSACGAVTFADCPLY